MHEWVEKLLILQDKDLRIARLDEQVRSVPVEKESANSLLTAAKAAVAAAKEKVVADGKAIKTLEIEVESIQTRVREFQAKSAMIKSNDEYKAALHQIDTCRQQVRQYEDRELVLMEELEKSRRNLEACEKELAAARSRLGETVADLDTRARNCATQLSALQQERQAALPGIPADVLRRYDRVRVSRRLGDKRAFVPVREGTCDACHMSVTAQTRMNVRKGQPVTCQNCGVLLFIED
jgi:predicted  nucleic acid-binding Zn-ribbon protein